jgi:hypothetical protein
LLIQQNKTAPENAPFNLWKYSSLSRKLHNQSLFVENSEKYHNNEAQNPTTPLNLALFLSFRQKENL